MVELRVSKIDAARRQINAAIRLLFDGFDPVPVHTLACAGFRILRDLCEQKGAPAHKQLKAMIRPGKEQKFWGGINRASNFFKHADRDADADAILEGIKEESNECVLILAVQWYLDLGYKLTIEMNALQLWFAVTHPDLLVDDLPADINRAIAMTGDWRNSPRAEQLAAGKSLLQVAGTYRG